ncbi:MAG: GNAT family N-acetyltransferase [Steroidobacteraceae bacterium]
MGTEKPASIISGLAFDHHRMIGENGKGVKQRAMMLAAIQAMADAHPIGQSGRHHSHIATPTAAHESLHAAPPQDQASSNLCFTKAGTAMQLIACKLEAHGSEIIAIFNEAIANSTALYDYRPRALASMASWFKAKQDGNFPVIGAVGDSGQLLGFASYGSFRAWPAYKYTVEHSLYVHHEHRGKGIGGVLLKELIANARQQQYHCIVGGIDADNATSIAMHAKFGFTHAGTIRQAGFKFGRWLDLAFYQLLLETPVSPVDG